MCSTQGALQCSLLGNICTSVPKRYGVVELVLWELHETAPLKTHETLAVVVATKRLH